MKINLSIIIFALSIFCKTEAQQLDVNTLTSRIDLILNKNNFNGVVLITKGGITLFSKALGYSDLENKIPMTLNNQFVIGSISKQITAVLILKEFENGKINLTDKINDYLPEIKQLWSKDITIHHLLTHTHGIIDLEKPLEFVPGSQFHYSQLGYELLARILEIVTKKSFEKMTTEYFKTYNLDHTFHPDNKDYKNLVKGYVEEKNGSMIYQTNSLQNYAAAGSFISNAEDLNKWNKLLYSGQLVTKETLKLMETKYATRIHPIFKKIDYGYGLLFNDGEQNTQIGALGYAPGFVSACYYYPQTDINLIVLENIDRDSDDFKNSFNVHTELMELIKKESTTK